jgi:hypothetical protein
MDTTNPSAGFEPDIQTKRHSYGSRAWQDSRWWHVIVFLVKAIIYFLLPDRVQSPWCSMAKCVLTFAQQSTTPGGARVDTAANCIHSVRLHRRTVPLRTAGEKYLWTPNKVKIYYLSLSKLRLELYQNSIQNIPIHKHTKLNSYYWHFYTSSTWPGQLSRCSDSLRPGRSGDRIPVGARISAPVQTFPVGPPSFLYNEYRVFPGSKSAGAWRWPPTLI